MTESGRELRAELLPDESFVSVLTLAEFRAGVHAAKDTETAADELPVFTQDSDYEVLSDLGGLVVVRV